MTWRTLTAALRIVDTLREMKRPEPRPDLRPFYLLLVAVGGVLAHLASEFGAMGADARSVLLSPRHWYLGLGAIAGAITFVVQANALIRGSSNGLDLKRRLHAGLRTLPFGGRGAAFAALTAVLQFAVGMSTELGEGAPIAGHDVAGGVLGAALIVAAIAAIGRAIAKNIPSIVVALVWVVAVPASTAFASARRTRFALVAVRMAEWTPQRFNRPPPPLSHAASFA